MDGAKGRGAPFHDGDEESVETISLSAKELEDFRKVFPVALDADKFSIED